MFVYVFICIGGNFFLHLWVIITTAFRTINAHLKLNLNFIPFFTSFIYYLTYEYMCIRIVIILFTEMQLIFIGLTQLIVVLVYRASESCYSDGGWATTEWLYLNICTSLSFLRDRTNEYCINYEVNSKWRPYQLSKVSKNRTEYIFAWDDVYVLTMFELGIFSLWMKYYSMNYDIVTS